MTILLFRDVGLDAVAEYLRGRRVPHVVIDWDAIAKEGDLSLRISGEHLGGTIRAGGETLDLADISCVAYNPPRFTMLGQHFGPHSGIYERLTHARWLYALNELHAVMPGVPWVPGLPLACERATAQRKLAELALARRLGLRVPDTICTTSPEEVTRFREQHRGGTLFREWALPVIPLPGRKLAYFKVALDCDDAEELESIAQSPTIFQEYLDKDYELRAVIVGDEVITLKIDSQASTVDKVDWRAYDFDNVALSRYALPRSIADKLVTFAESVGMAFGSADLVRTRDGEYVFLELNRPGAWGFFSTVADLGIEQRLGELLIRLSKGIQRGGRLLHEGAHL
jgi:hypothetical protein